MGFALSIKSSQVKGRSTERAIITLKNKLKKETQKINLEKKLKKET